jgi:hypothetical protein
MVDQPSSSVTFLFTDLERSTPLWEQHPDEMRAALARHDEILRTAVESWRRRGQTTGDVSMPCSQWRPTLLRGGRGAERTRERAVAFRTLSCSNGPPYRHADCGAETTSARRSTAPPAAKAPPSRSDPRLRCGAALLDGWNLLDLASTGCGVTPISCNRSLRRDSPSSSHHWRRRPWNRSAQLADDARGRAAEVDAVRTLFVSADRR